MLSFIKSVVKRILRVNERRIHAYFVADERRFVRYSGVLDASNVRAVEAKIIMHYHVIEKGLTMPNRRLGFGKAVLTAMIDLIMWYEASGANRSPHVDYAIGVAKEYDYLHAKCGCDRSSDAQFWNKVETFVSKHSAYPRSEQLHFKRSEFYSQVAARFADFASARHCVRHYCDKPVAREKIETAVRIACTAPSACNRNHGRVHCITDKSLCQEILKVQGGNRGFGHLADKVLIVTADMKCQVSARERNDDYINGGMFLMNLCYALYASEVAYCILTWSVELGKDAWIHEVAKIPESEAIIALLCVGEAPEEFDVAASPRRTVEEVLTWK